jgi:2,3-bisphosphoglycerate-independent phosphoglycerate mutase
MRPLLLIILDGWGMAPAWGGNAISLAKTPVFNKIWREYPHTQIAASGVYVGLTGHERGNSETGHLNLGAGQIVHQDKTVIDKAIENKTFFTNDLLLAACDHVKKNNSRLHLLGLVSDGGVHSHINHLFALLELAQKNNITNVFIHFITDGRDTPQGKALTYLQQLRTHIDKLKTYSKQNQEINIQIATVSGRFYAMDRDHRWKRTQQAYEAMVLGKGQIAESAGQAISQAYRSGKTDEIIEPTVIVKENKPIGLVLENDAIIFFNFRGDRAWQLSAPFVSPEFKEFPRQNFKNLFFVGFTDYRPERITIKYVFSPERPQNPIANVLSSAGKTQLHIAETEKFAHVTYFFNGGRELPFPNEGRILVPSPKVKSYAATPRMSADEITENVIEELNKKHYDFYIINFANPDMVGHTGSLEATIVACEAVDQCLGKILQKSLSLEAINIITADHGNAEQMINPQTGEPDPEHTNNPVPFILVSEKYKQKKLKPIKGKLANVAPTILELIGIEKPEEMNEESLIM